MLCAKVGRDQKRHEAWGLVVDWGPFVDVDRDTYLITSPEPIHLLSPNAQSTTVTIAHSVDNHARNYNKNVEWAGTTAQATGARLGTRAYELPANGVSTCVLVCCGVCVAGRECVVPVCCIIACIYFKGRLLTKFAP